MNPTVTIGQLREELGYLIEGGYDEDRPLVLTTRENAGSLIGLAVEGFDRTLDPVGGIVFSGIEGI